MRITPQQWEQGGPRWMALALCPSATLDPEWAAALLPPRLCNSALSARTHRFVSCFIELQLQLEPIPDPDACPPLLWEVACLPQLALLRYMRYLGAVHTAFEVSQVLLRHDVMAYRDALGEDLYHFMLCELPLLAGPVTPAGLQHGAAEIRTATERAGYLLLRQLYEEHGRTLWQRMQLRLPRLGGDPSALASPTEASDRLSLARRIFLHLHPDVRSEGMSVSKEGL